MPAPGSSPVGRIHAWLRAKDPELAVTRRAARAALVLPGLFALCTYILHSPTMATFAAFGSVSMLLFVDYAGPTARRLRAHMGLAAAWGVLICLGTVAARESWLAVLTMTGVGFLVLFAGVVSSVLAGSATALLLGFILPVTSPVPLSEVPERLAGAGLAAGASALAVTLLWPLPAADPLSAPAAQVCRTVATQLRTDASRRTGGPHSPSIHRYREVASQAADAAAALRTAFEATPYRPTALSTSSRALVRLVDELTWLSIIAAAGELSPEHRPACDPDAHTVQRAVATALERTAVLLEAPRTRPDALQSATAGLHQAMTGMEDNASTRLPEQQQGPSSEEEFRAFLETLDLSFGAQELGFVALQVAANAELFATAHQRTWRERLLGRQPGAPKKPLASALDRAKAHFQRHSVWLHNSLRGAVGLGTAVALVYLADVQNSFWVLLGTLSVLRSNALNTGQSAIRALGGTCVGSALGAALLYALHDQRAVLWFLLPLAVLIAGIAPAAISFTVGQAAFTVTLIILFSVGHGSNWHIALLRAQDIGIGCGVGLLVGLLFWPRGAATAVGRALADAYTQSSRYLAAAVQYAVNCCEPSSTTAPGPPMEDGRQAAAAAHRLDDAFRTYLAERGAKPLALADMTALVTGVAGLRLAADAVLSLWQHASDASTPLSRGHARLALLEAAARVTHWYLYLAASLEKGAGSPPAPLPPDQTVVTRLVGSILDELYTESGQATTTAVRVIWTGDHIKAARRLQPRLWSAARNSGLTS